MNKLLKNQTNLFVIILVVVVAVSQVGIQLFMGSIKIQMKN